MKLVILIGVSYFYFYQMILTSTSEIDGDKILGEAHKSKEVQLNDQMNRKTELMDLNDDCQLLILEYLDFMSLLSLADINSRYRSLVSAMVKPIFRKRMVNIALTHRYASRSFRIIIENETIKITNFAIAEQFVKNFGHLIKNLKLNGAYRDLHNATRSIYQLVNLHCSKTLNEITIVIFTKNFMNEFTNKFEAVESVNLWDTWNTERNLNDIFPAVRRLDIRLFDVSHFHLINVEYKHLDHLGLYMYKHNVEETLINELASELIKTNPHIRSLKFGRVSAEMLKMIAISVPKLEKLELEHMQSNYNNKSIEFQNVKVLIVSGTNIDAFFRNVKFDNVEEIDTNCLTKSMLGKTGFIERNKNLKKLRLVPDGMMYLNSNIFRQFSRFKSTLQDIFISYAFDFELNTFLQLIDNNKQLQRFEIVFFRSQSREAASEALRDRIAHIWCIDEFGKNLILRKKKISCL